MALATINAIWIGPTMGPLHAACLRSFVRHGHRTILYVYERPIDTPDGVELADAAELLPASRIVRYRAGGSLALFSNLLRYEILKKGLGLYVDCDCFCLAPIEDAERIYGWDSARHMNSAVLKMPQDCPALAKLIAIKDNPAHQTPWLGRRRHAYQKLRAWLNIPISIENLPWGSTGPHAVTWYLKEHGLERHARPIDDFYPLHFDQAALLLEPGLSIADVTTSRSRIIHLWHEKLRHFDLSAIPPSSPIGEMLAL